MEPFTKSVFTYHTEKFLFHLYGGPMEPLFLLQEVLNLPIFDCTKEIWKNMRPKFKVYIEIKDFMGRSNSVPAITKQVLLYLVVFQGLRSEYMMVKFLDWIFDLERDFVKILSLEK